MDQRHRRFKYKQVTSTLYGFMSNTFSLADRNKTHWYQGDTLLLKIQMKNTVFISNQIVKNISLLYYQYI